MLVIIALIIAGILVGQDMISASAVRMQIAQIEKYNSAVHTFQSKFGAIPGDMPVATATQFGFTIGLSCNGTQGYRDGNGLVDGGPSPNIYGQPTGEIGLFWVDLSAANLIDGTFTNPQNVGSCMGNVTLQSTGISGYFPTAKIGYGNYLYVLDYNGSNWFGLANIYYVTNGEFNNNATSGNIPVLQAYNMDLKTDDGIPTTGNIMSKYTPGSHSFQTGKVIPVAGGNATSCYDSTTNLYSTSFNGGSGPNCALIFRFQ